MAGNRDTHLNFDLRAAESLLPSLPPPQSLSTSPPTRTRPRVKQTRLAPASILPILEEVVGDSPVAKPLQLSSIDLLNQHYEELNELQLGLRAFKVVRTRRNTNRERNSFGGLLSTFTGSNTSQEVRQLQEIRHDSFLEVLDIYEGDGHLAVVFDFMHLSLVEVATVRNLREPDIATIFDQVLAGLLYLDGQHLGHSELTCSNILVHLDGRVKIGAQQHCLVSSAGTLCKAFSRLVMEFMQGFLPNDPVGSRYLVDLAYWQSMPLLIDFLDKTETRAATVSANVSDKLSVDSTELNRLAEHKFIRSRSDPRALMIPLTYLIETVAMCVEPSRIE